MLLPAAILALVPAGEAVVPRPARPSVLYIVVDDLRVELPMCAAR
jgi:hypothetical protein